MHLAPGLQGLTLLECATGKYPYDASGGTIQLMIQVGAAAWGQVQLWQASVAVAPASLLAAEVVPICDKGS